MLYIQNRHEQINLARASNWAGCGADFVSLEKLDGEGTSIPLVQDINRRIEHSSSMV